MFFRQLLNGILPVFITHFIAFICNNQYLTLLRYSKAIDFRQAIFYHLNRLIYWTGGIIKNDCPMCHSIKTFDLKSSTGFWIPDLQFYSNPNIFLYAIPNSTPRVLLYSSPNKSFTNLFISEDFPT